MKFLGERAEEHRTIMKTIMIEIINLVSREVSKCEREKGEERFTKGYQGEGGGGSGRIGLDCGLGFVLVGGVEGNGRESCFGGTTGRVRFRWKDWKVSPGGRIKLSLREGKPSGVVTISTS